MLANYADLWEATIPNAKLAFSQVSTKLKTSAYASYVLRAEDAYWILELFPLPPFIPTPAT